MKKLILLLLFVSTLFSQTQNKREPLTADMVLNEVKADVSTCMIDKGKVVASLRIEKEYTQKLELEITMLQTKLKDLEVKVSGSK